MLTPQNDQLSLLSMSVVLNWKWILGTTIEIQNKINGKQQTQSLSS